MEPSLAAGHTRREGRWPSQPRAPVSVANSEPARCPVPRVLPGNRPRWELLPAAGLDVLVDVEGVVRVVAVLDLGQPVVVAAVGGPDPVLALAHHEVDVRSEEHTSELQSHVNLVCRL